MCKQVVGNSLKSLEVSEEKANQRVEEFKRQLKSLTIKLKEAENRAELAEKTVKKLQKEVDRLEGMTFGFWNSSNIIFFFQNFIFDEKKRKKKIRKFFSSRNIHYERGKTYLYTHLYMFFSFLF
jgi:galactokinase